MEEIKYRLIFSDLIQEKISILVSQYHLGIDSNLSLSERLKKKDPEIIIFHLAEKILSREGKFKDIVETLEKELKVNKEDAEKLAHGIKNEVVSLADEIEPEEEELEIEEPEPKDEEISIQEALIEKLKGEILDDTEELMNERTEKLKNGGTQEQEEVEPISVNVSPNAKNFSGTKQVPVQDVDENAKELKEKREEAAKPGTVGSRSPTQPDPYREPTD